MNNYSGYNNGYFGAPNGGYAAPANNAYYTGQTYDPNGGIQYGQTPAPAKMTQLTPEEQKTLQTNRHADVMKIEPIELLKAKCTHKRGNDITLVENPDGSNTCQVCGETFRMSTMEPVQLDALVQQVTDAIQTLKTLYLDMPENIQANFLPISVYFQRLPHLYKIALDNFDKYNVRVHANHNSPYGFGMLNQLMGGGMPMGMAPGYGQPNMAPQYGYGQPNMAPGYGQPNMAPQYGYGQPNMMGGNPLAYNGDPSQNPNAVPAGQNPQANNQPVQGQNPQANVVDSTKAWNA